MCSMIAAHWRCLLTLELSGGVAVRLERDVRQSRGISQGAAIDYEIRELISQAKHDVVVMRLMHFVEAEVEPRVREGAVR